MIFMLKSKCAFPFILCALITFSFSAHAEQSDAEKNDIAALKVEAITIVKQFGGALKPQLKKALKEGGVEHAIKVCSEKAPQIANNLSDKTKWTVKRVSLKARNNTAQPDPWETMILKEFDHQQQQGQPVNTMAKAAIIENQFRLMKAQGVAPLCLTCHGTELSNEAIKALKNYYPNDKATGYHLGQVRGAFSLVKKL